MSPRTAGLALLVVGALTGCGSVSASLRDLRHDAGAICRRTNRAFGRFPTLPSQTAVTAFLSGGVSRLSDELARLRRVSPPRDVADVYRAAVSALTEELAVLRGTVAAIRRGQDPAAAFKVLKLKLAPLESQVNDAWQALQVPGCLQ